MKARYYLQIDILKALAIIAVIVIHSFDQMTKLITNSNFEVSTVTITNTLSTTSIIQLNHITLSSILSSVKVLSFWQAVPIFFILMGITLGLSFKRHNYNTLSEIYTKTYFKSRFKRLYFPYIILLLISISLGLLILLVTGFNILGNFSYLNLIGFLPLNGPDYGSYFVTLVFQVIFIFPLIYIIYKRNPNLMLISAIIVDIIYQIFAYYYINGFINSICIIRFISALTMGLWISDQDYYLDKSLDVMTKYKNYLFKNKLFVSAGLLGLTYLIIWYFLSMGYLNSLFYPFPYFNNKFNTFGSQNILSFIYASFLIVLGLLMFSNNSTNKIFSKISLIGKASYHIFLIQILYFHIFSLAIIIVPNSIISKFVVVVCDIGLCIILGIGFYYLEKKTYQYLIIKREAHKKNNKNIPIN